MPALRVALCPRTLVATAALLLTGCLPAPEPPPPINVAPGLQAEYLVYRAAQPMALAFAPDGRVFYTEKNTGRIRVISDGQLVEQPFAEVPVNFAGDRGLLGIAVHPSFNLNGRVYVFYSRSDTGSPTDDARAIVDNRIVYFQANGDVARGGEVFVVSLPAGEQADRVGGRIAFSSDGRLFVAIGDLGNQDNAQDPGVLAGKLLRYNDDGTISADNPDRNSPVYAQGFRDPRGLAIDPQTGVPYVLDRSPRRFHEVNRVEAGRTYGWPIIIGPADSAQELEFAAANPSCRDPIFSSGEDRNPFVGIGFNPSTKYGSSTRLRLFYALRDTGAVYNLEFVADRTAVVDDHWFAGGLPTPVTDLAFTPAGTLYVAAEAAILRVVSLR